MTTTLEGPILVTYAYNNPRNQGAMAEEDPRKQRLAELREEHRKLDTEIAELTAQAAYDQLEVKRLKKRKLRLKDEIARLESALVPDIIA